MSLSDNLNLETVIDNGFTDDAGNPLKGTFTVVGSTIRRTPGIGNVIGAARFTITLDASGNLTKQLPANVDADIQDLGDDDYYTVTPNLTDANGQPLSTPFPSFRMVLVAGSGPYRLSDFIFGDDHGNPRTDLSGPLRAGYPASTVYPASTLYPTGSSTANSLGVPRLATSGNKIIRVDNGNQVILAGSNWMYHEHHGDTVTINNLVAKMRSSWGGNLASFGIATRAVMNNTSHPYSGTPYLTLLDQLVNICETNNCYTIFAPRWSGIEGRTTDAGSPTQTQFVDIPPQEAIDALAKLAARYASRTGVMFAAQVETNGSVTWAQARDYYQACVTAVQTANPLKPIVATSGLDYGRDVSGALTNPVTGQNVVYKSHIYNRPSTWASDFGNVYDAGLPVLIGEFGKVNFGEPDVLDDSDIAALMAYLSARKMPWCSWGFEIEANPTLLTDEATANPVAGWAVTVQTQMRRTPPKPGDGYQT